MGHGLIEHQSITHGLPCTLKHAVHSMDYFIHCTDEAQHRDRSSCLMLHHRYRYYIGPYSAYGCTDKYRYPVWEFDKKLTTSPSNGITVIGTTHSSWPLFCLHRVQVPWALWQQETVSTPYECVWVYSNVTGMATTPSQSPRGHSTGVCKPFTVVKTCFPDVLTPIANTIYSDTSVTPWRQVHLMTRSTSW